MRIFGLLPFFLAVGCSTNMALLTPDVVEKSTTLKTSKFDSASLAQGPQFQVSLSNSLTNVSWYDATMMATIDQAHAVSPSQVSVIVYYTDSSWRFYDSASFVGGVMVPLSIVGRSVLKCGGVGGCDYSEAFLLTLTPKQLADAETKGLEVRINAKAGGNFVLILTADYATGFERAVGIFASH